MWRTQVIALIQANALKSLIDGSNLSPNCILIQGNGNQRIATYVNPNFIAWQRQNQALMRWILSLLTENILGIVTSSTTSYEVWTTLERTFASQTKARTLELRMQLQSCKKEHLSVTDFYNKMKSLANNVIVAGNIITDEELTIHILSGLEAEYDRLVVNAIAQSLEP